MKKFLIFCTNGRDDIEILKTIRHAETIGALANVIGVELQIGTPDYHGLSPTEYAFQIEAEALAGLFDVPANVKIGAEWWVGAREIENVPDTKKILSQKIGVKRECGTDFPIYLEIERDGGEYRIVQRCNADAAILGLYETIEDARRDFGIMWGESQFGEGAL